MYVLIHEIVHIYDPRFSSPHDDYFWKLLSHLLIVAFNLRLLDPTIFKKNIKRCGQEITHEGDYYKILTMGCMRVPFNDKVRALM